LTKKGKNMNKKIVGVIVLVAIICSILFSGCAVPSGGCPYCGYPPGTALDGQDISCPRCGGTYRVFMDGSVSATSRPTQQYQYPVPINNTDASQRTLNQNGALILEGLRK
jgi:hypothetical protein